MVADYIEGGEVAELLRGPEKDKTCVLDVRDEDFRGGHIPGCLNIWSDDFADDASVDSIIQKLASRLAILDMDQKPAVRVLYGGMRKFKQEYGNQPDLLEGS